MVIEKMIPLKASTKILYAVKHTNFIDFYNLKASLLL